MMKKAMYRLMMDRLMTLMLHLLVSAVMVMFLWLLLPLPSAVAVVCCSDTLKHFIILFCLGDVELDAVLSDAVGIILGAAMIVALA